MGRQANGKHLWIAIHTKSNSAFWHLIDFDGSACWPSVGHAFEIPGIQKCLLLLGCVAQCFAALENHNGRVSRSIIFLPTSSSSRNPSAAIRDRCYKLTICSLTSGLVHTEKADKAESYSPFQNKQNSEYILFFFKGNFPNITPVTWHEDNSKELWRG